MGIDYKHAWEQLTKQVDVKLEEAKRLDEIDAYNGIAGFRANHYLEFKEMMASCLLQQNKLNV